MRRYVGPPHSKSLDSSQKDIRDWLDHQREPISLEIGCGVGYHPIQWALRHPNECLLAFERTTAKFNKALRRQAHHSLLQNLKIIHGDVFYYIDFIKNSGLYFKTIMSFYPNPYPKNSHKNRRWAYSVAFYELIQRLDTQGQLIVTSDQKSYIDEMAQEIPKNSSLFLMELKILEKDQKPRTHFEKKYLEQNKICYEIIFKNEKFCQLKTDHL